MKTKQETTKGKIYPAKELSLENRPTKNYDFVSNKVRKLLSATAQTFIPELCEALKNDWFPTMPEKELQKNKGIRDAIRDKILNEWSNETIYSHSQDNIWSDRTIKIFFPKWLRNPSENLTMETAREAKINKKLLISEHEKKKIEQIAEELPQDVIVEEEEETPTGLTDETMHELGVAPYGETGRSTRDLTGDISLYAYKLFAALTNNNSPPNTSDDLLVDYIRPSREFRRGLMLEVGSNRRAAIHNALHYASVAIEDMIEIIDEIDRKEK